MTSRSRRVARRRVPRPLRARTSVVRAEFVRYLRFQPMAKSQFAEGRMTMTRRLLAAAPMAAGLLLCSIAAIETAVAEPVEVTVLTSVALTSALDELAAQFERSTGTKLKIGYSLIADVKKRVLAGETADVIILSRPAMDDLLKQDKLTPGSIANMAGTPVAVAVKAGAPKPDISSADALKRSLLAAKSVVYA